MSNPLLEQLLAAGGPGFEGDIGRSVVFARARELPAAEARAFYLTTLGHAALPWFVKKAIAVELEWWRFSDLAPALTALGQEVPGLALHIEALTAMAGAERCVCDVYAQHAATTPSPLMEKLRDLDSGHPQVDRCEYRCTVCGATLEHSSAHHERGATLHSWCLSEGV